jgi:2'-5' RNA ligase
MGYAVEMFFDGRTEDTLTRLQHRLTEKGLPSPVVADGQKPHLSLCVYDDLDAGRTDVLLKEFCAQEKRFGLRLGILGTFLTTENVIFAAPALTEALRTMHLRFHRAFQELAGTAWSYYLPGNWQPHCTLAFELPEPQFHDVFRVIRNEFKPMEATIESIGLVRFKPTKILMEYELPYQTSSAHGERQA